MEVENLNEPKKPALNKGAVIRCFDFPSYNKRVETGVIKFGNDLKALHLRGDDCFALKIELEKVIQNTKFYEYPQCKYILELINDVLGNQNCV